MRLRNFRLTKGALAASLALAAVATSPVLANSHYPSKPVTWVVPYNPGGATDGIARLLAQKLGEAVDQSVVISNVPGAGTVIGATQVARADPDGYRIMSADIATLAINPALMTDVNYDPVTSFTAIGQIARLPLILVVHKDVPVSTASELIEYAQSGTSDLNYASAGPGSPHHLGMEFFQQLAGTNMTHVPYNGTGPAMADLLSGRIDLMFGSLGAVLPHIEAGTLKAIGVSGTDPLAGLDGVVPLADSDSRLADFEMYAWQGVIGPAGISDDITQKLNRHLQTILAMDDVHERLTAMGVEAVPSSPEAFQAYIESEVELWKRVIDERGLKNP